MKNKYYTGVGSRKTPSDILKLMTKLAYELSNLGYVLRSGRAIGADKAFEAGAGFAKKIYLAKDSNQECIELANRFHPYDLTKCKSYIQQLHGRNVKQVCGDNLNKPILSQFLICWTVDGCLNHKSRTYKTGGTGTAISIADHFNIPVFNLQRNNELERFNLFIKDSLSNKE